MFRLISVSQAIFKFQILPVSQIEPFLVHKFDVARLCSLCSLDLVLSDTIPMNEDDIQNAKTVTYNDGDFSGDVSWSIFWSERLWSDDISCT